MGNFFSNVGHAITKAVKNPLQPITHAAGKTLGVTANLKNGVHIDPSKLLTDAMAFTGNPAAIAALAGNAAGAIAPRSTLGHIGDTVGKYAPIVAGMTGGLSGLSKLPGVSAIGSKLGEIPGVSSVGSRVSSLLGLGGGGGVPDLNPADAAKMIGITPSVAGAGAAGAEAAGGGGILSSITGMLGLGDMSTADKIALAKLGVSTAGGIAGGIQSANDKAKALAEQQREYNIPSGAAASRALTNIPLRNMGAAGLAGYAAAGPPAAFKPHDIFNAGGEGASQPGGYNPASVAAGRAAFKPNPDEEETYRRILAMTGFGGGVA
jgi:hypothetical protein